MLDESNPLISQDNKFSTWLKEYYLLFIPFLFELINQFALISTILVLNYYICYYFVFGFEFLFFICSFTTKRKTEHSMNFNFIEMFAYSLTAGIILNLLYCLTIFIHIYQNGLVFLIYYEIIALIFILNKYRLKNEFSLMKNIQKQDVVILLVLLIQVVFLIISVYVQVPIPGQNGWDILYYEGKAISFYNGQSSTIIDINRFPGFDIILANILIVIPLNPAYLFPDISNLGQFFTNGLCTLYIYLIIMTLTKSENNWSYN